MPNVGRYCLEKVDGYTYLLDTHSGDMWRVKDVGEGSMREREIELVYVKRPPPSKT